MSNVLSNQDQILVSSPPKGMPSLGCSLLHAAPYFSVDWYPSSWVYHKPNWQNMPEAWYFYAQYLYT